RERSDVTSRSPSSQPLPGIPGRSSSSAEAIASPFQSVDHIRSTVRKPRGTSVRIVGGRGLLGVAGWRRAWWKVHSCAGPPLAVTDRRWTVRGRYLDQAAPLRGAGSGAPRAGLCLRPARAVPLATVP